MIINEELQRKDKEILCVLIGQFFDAKYNKTIDIIRDSHLKNLYDFLWTFIEETK